MSQQYVDRERQFFILKILGLCLVVMIVAYLVFANYSKVQTQNRTQIASKNIIALKLGIQSIFSNQSTYDGLNSELMVKAKMAPEGMVMLDGLKNVYGGKVYLKEETSSPEINNAFSIEYTHIPSSDCFDFVASIQMDFVLVSIGDGKNFKIIKNQVKTPNLNIDSKELMSACQSSNTVNVKMYSF